MSSRYKIPEFSQMFCAEIVEFLSRFAYGCHGQGSHPGDTFYLIPDPVARSALSTGTEAVEPEKLANAINVGMALDARHHFILLHYVGDRNRLGLCGLLQASKPFIHAGTGLNSAMGYFEAKTTVAEHGGIDFPVRRRF
jgi:hypothetical protein